MEGEKMKKRLLIVAFTFIFIMIVFLLSACSGTTPKTIVITEGEESITYNGVIYKEFDYMYDFQKGFILPAWEKVDFSTLIDEDEYVPKGTYYVYKHDNYDSPCVFYKENTTPLGVSGWLYIRDDFDLLFYDLEKSEIVEVRALYIPEGWTTQDKDVIDRIKQAMINKENLVPIISEYTDVKWTQIYVRYENSPFLQKIGYKEDGDFVYEIDIKE